MKKFRPLAFILTIMMMFTIYTPMGGTVYADTLYTDPVDGSRYYYTTSNGEAQITDFFSGSSNNIIIPTSLGGCTVTTIGAWSFERVFQSTLTSVTIPSTVRYIGERAFYECTYLETITIASSEASPSALTTVYNEAFRGCSKLTSINIPASVTQIGPYAFYGCTSLSAIVFPDGLSTIGAYAFKDCSSLISITIPGISIINSNTFYGCSKLTNVVLPSGLTAIGGYAFSGCYSLISINIPSSVTSIGDNTFYNCEELNPIALPDGLTTIGGSAFSGCDSLITVTIPSIVTTIGALAFFDCKSLTAINVASDNANYSSNSEGVLFNKDRSLLIVYPIGNTDVSYTIPSSVTTIENNAFYYAKFLTSITIPSIVTTIGSSAFEYCSSLASIVIPSGVTIIDDYTFSNCKDLATITIPSTVTTIDDYAFSNCKDLATITIPSTVTTIGDYAFSDCTSLTSITIPSSVITIESYAFRSCTNLKTAYFEGNAESTFNKNMFRSTTDFAIYNLEGTTGWTTPTWGSISYNYPCSPYKAEGSGADPVVVTPHRHAVIPVVVSPVISNILRFKINLTNSYVRTGDAEEVLHPMDTAPILFENRTLLPIRFVVEPLGGSIHWSQSDKKVTITRGTITIELWIDNNVAKVNGIDKVIDPDNALIKPMIVNPGRTMLPLRFISEALGCTVDWDAFNKEILVSNW